MHSKNAPTMPELKRQAIAHLRKSVPANWRVGPVLEDSVDTQEETIHIDIEAADGRQCHLVMMVRHGMERRDVVSTVTRLRDLTLSPTDVPLVGARYLSESVREALVAEGVSYVDATGNMRVVCEAPAVFILTQGDNRDPWRRGRPRNSLKGEPAARVVRTLLDYRREWRIRNLIDESGASTGATYRVLDYLLREELVTKDSDQYHVTDWERLLREWSADAPFSQTARVGTFLEPRGLDGFLRKLAGDADSPIAVTGTVAAKEWVHYTPSKAVFVYVPSLHSAAERWGLRPHTTAPNVILLEPEKNGDIPFRHARQSEAGYPIASPVQVAADLLNGPGREPSEGEYLIAWMKGHEDEWRRA